MNKPREMITTKCHPPFIFLLYILLTRNMPYFTSPLLLESLLLSNTYQYIIGFYYKYILYSDAPRDTMYMDKLGKELRMDKEIMKGSIDILLLSIICKKDSYGYEIVKELNVKSNNLYNMSEGTLYPALKRLETKGFLECYWIDLENGSRRKYYRITDKGTKELSSKVHDWQKVDGLIRICAEGLI